MTNVWRSGALAAFAACFAVSAATADTLPAAERLAGLKAQYRRPSEIPFPAFNPYTPEKAALGKALYVDPRVSASQNMNCATCHNPSFGWQVPLKGATGARDAVLARNAPTILNQAWGGSHYFWDGRAQSLEEQAKGPIQAELEMNMPLPALVKRLAGIAEYKRWFGTVFLGEGVSGDSIAKAIATYERTVVSGFAPFDSWIEGDESAISDEAKRGFLLFVGKADCAACHTGWNFSDNKFHDTGLPGDDPGRGKLEPDNPQANHAFKTPTLRDIARRAPYMHDGSLTSLRAVMAHYVEGGADRSSKPSRPAVELDAKEVDALIAFLGTLTGAEQVISLPVLPN